MPSFPKVLAFIRAPTTSHCFLAHLFAYRNQSRKFHDTCNQSCAYRMMQSLQFGYEIDFKPPMKVNYLKAHSNANNAN